MLPTTFNDRFSQIMNIKNEELSSEAQTRFSTRSSELAGRGHLGPHVAPSIRHENAVWITTRRIECVVEAIKRLFASGHELPYSETLAAELKHLVESGTTEIWCKQLVDNYGSLLADQRPKYDNELSNVRGKALHSANLEIDLLVDDLKSKIGKAQTQAKEAEQKFGILLSARQAGIDYQEWANELKSQSAMIAVLFVDIDNFKSLNTKYSNAVVDKTILPDAMRLIHHLVIFRGGSYRHGGEEFVIILPNCNLSEAVSFAEKVRSAFEAIEFRVEKTVERLTVSIGIALGPQHGSTFDEVLEAANLAELEAKHSRNSCVIAKS